MAVANQPIEQLTDPPTRVAVLGTLAEFHRRPIPFDLPALVQLVAALNPDLLCLDMAPAQWQQRDFEGLPPEYVEGLIPLADQTDIVVVPIGGARLPVEPTALGRRGQLIALLRGWLTAIQRTAPDPTDVNQGWRHDLSNLLYHLIDRLVGGQVEQQWRTHRHHLAQQVLALARRDPGRRILVVVNVRHCHHLRPALRAYAEVEVVSYPEL